MSGFYKYFVLGQYLWVEKLTTLAAGTGFAALEADNATGVVDGRLQQLLVSLGLFGECRGYVNDGDREFISFSGETIHGRHEHLSAFLGAAIVIAIV